jgi:hypothetical protein
LELIWAVQSLAPLREPGRLKALGRALESEPDLAYKHVARSFPPQRQLKGSLADLLGAYEGRLGPNQPEMWFFARHEAPAGDGELYVADDRHLGRDMPHSINAAFHDTEWFNSPERLHSLAAYLTRVADAASAFYAYCGSSDVLDQRIKLLERNAETIFGRLLKVGRVMEDLHHELPDVYWWNYFGPAFVKKWNGRLDGLGVRQESTPAGARVVWATETPFVLDPSVKRLEDYPWKKPFYAALGDDTFMREGQKQRSTGEAVPDFNAHRVAAGAAPMPAADGASAQAKFMPRIARLRDLPPEDAEFEEARAELIENEGLDVHLTADKAVPVDEVVRWLKSRNEMAVCGPDEGGLIVYRNPDTGVVAGFETERLGLRFRLPWLRPMFFAREAMPIVVDLAEKFDLRLPTQASTLRELVELWGKGNADAVRRSDETLPYMTPERSERWWLYQSRKQDLHRRLGEDVFVPTLVAVAPGRRADDLRLHITWTDGSPLLLPECELVTLLEGRRPSDFKLRGTADYEAVRKALEPYLESLSVEGLGTVALLTPSAAKEARRAFVELPTRAFDHVEVDPAKWVDVSQPDRQETG